MSIIDRSQWQEEVENCKVCGGCGSIEIADAGLIRIELCKCAQRAVAQERIVAAGIPRKLYSWDLRKLGKVFRFKNKDALNTIKKYINNIEINVKKGLGLWISSPPGLGKNHILCYILRLALEKNYEAQYIKARKLIDVKFDSWRNREARILLLRITEGSHIVAIADLEKAPISFNIEDIRAQNFYEILCDIDDSKISLLVSSNIPKLEVLKRMPSFMQSRFAAMKEVVLRYAKDAYGGIDHG